MMHVTVLSSIGRRPIDDCPSLGQRAVITVCEEIFLPTLDYDTGRPSTRLSARSLRTALGGALLMDLAFADGIDTDLDGLFVVDPAPTGEPVLDRALACIVDDGERRPIDRRVGVFAEDYESVRPMLIEGLAKRVQRSRGVGTCVCRETNGWIEAAIVRAP